MNLWQSKLQAVSWAIDSGVRGLRVEAVEAAAKLEKPKYRVTQEFGGQTKRVAFNLSHRDADLFVKAMPPKMRRLVEPNVNGDYFERATYKIEEERRG